MRNLIDKGAWFNRQAFLFYLFRSLENSSEHFLFELPEKIELAKDETVCQQQHVVQWGHKKNIIDHAGLPITSVSVCKKIHDRFFDEHRGESSASKNDENQ